MASCYVALKLNFVLKMFLEFDRWSLDRELPPKLNLIITGASHTNALKSLPMNFLILAKNGCRLSKFVKKRMAFYMLCLPTQNYPKTSVEQKRLLLLQWRLITGEWPQHSIEKLTIRFFIKQVFSWSLHLSIRKNF